MPANERTSLLHATCQNGNGVVKKKDKLIIPMPKDPIFEFEDYWGGLTLEELLPYQDDPWWQRLRNTILYSFWLMVLLTFVTACIMAYFHGERSCTIIPNVSTTSSLLLPDPIAATSSTMLSEIINSSKVLALAT